MDVRKWVNLDFILGLYIWSMEILHISDEGYPALLKKIYDPPSRLFCYGDIDLLKKRSISIVGTRKITEYGRRIIDTFLTDFLATMDIVVVSGLAYGVDTYVHTVCLERGIATIAVIAGGINTGVPKGNTSLLESICKSGLVVSEYEEGMEVEKYMFVMRNRIVAGLSQSCLVIEASLDSGSLITARYALEANKDVYVVVGNIFSESSVGCNELAKQGAGIVNSLEDFREVLGLSNGQICIGF